MDGFGIENLIVESNNIYSKLKPSVSKTTKEIENELRDVLNFNGINYDLISTGSTSRNTYINEGLDSEYNPVDFDYYLVVNEKLNREQLKKIQNGLNVASKFNNNFGTDELNYNRNRFRVSLGIVSNSNANLSNPIVYQQNCPDFSQDEIEQIRSFKLFSQRTGIYGGFNKSLKGILIEQLILKHESFENSFNLLCESFEKKENLDIKHYSSQDLILNISEDCKKRILSINESCDTERIQTRRFDFEKWNKLNQNRVNLVFTIINNEVSNTRLKLNNSLNLVLGTNNLKYDIYSVESLDCNHKVFTSLKQISDNGIGELEKEIKKYNLKKSKIKK